MTTRLGLSAMKRHTSYAPLAALGYVLHHSDFFAPLREHVKLGGKTILHEPYRKLLDVVVSVLAKGYRGKRAKAFARAVPQWEELRTGARWMAPAPTPLRYDRRTQTAVVRWKTEQDTDRHRLLITS